MARRPRISYPGAIYHITARGNERRPIVRDDEDRQRFVRTLASMVEGYAVTCHAWVLMDNHYHLVLETPHGNVSAALRHLNGVYTQAFNRRHGRVGHLLQGRFSAILVDRDGYLLTVCRYVVLNPVRAGLVADPAHWRWSSYRATAGKDPTPAWLTVDTLLACFGSERGQAEASYRRFVAEGTHGMPSPWSGIAWRVALGGEAFLEDVRTRLGLSRESESRGPGFGRPSGDLLGGGGLPGSGGLPAPLRVVLAGVAQVYDVSPESLLQPRRPVGEARQVAIFGARRVAWLDVRETGERFGIGAPAVSRHVQAVAERMERDAEFAARVRASFGKRKT